MEFIQENYEVITIVLMVVGLFFAGSVYIKKNIVSMKQKNKKSANNYQIYNQKENDRND